MNRINNYDLEPGPYVSSEGFKVVVLDIITYQYSSLADLQEILPVPMVLVRNLVEKTKTEEAQPRYLYPIEIFKAKFKAI